MGLRQFKENRTKVHTRTDHLVPVAHDIATKQLIPQIAKMAENAVSVDKTEFYFYRHKRTGRRCSCFGTVNTTPDGDCPNCYNTGIVGGYDKYGCYEELLDVTRPSLRLVNIHPAYELVTRPILFVLDDDSKSGIIDVNMEVRPNVGLSDLIQINYSARDYQHSRVTAWIKGERDTYFSLLTEDSFKQALFGKTFKIQVRIFRENTSIPSPLLQDVRLRYRLIDNPRIVADVPVRQESQILGSFGIYDQNQQITMYLSSTPRNVQNQDFFIMVEEGTRWRAVERAPNKPNNQLLSHFLTCQNVPAHDPVYKFPV